MVKNNNNYYAVEKKTADAHWKENSSTVIVLLAIWLLVTWVAAIFAAQLNEIVILGFPMGYTTGSLVALVTYVVLIFYYAYRMDKIDEKYGMREEE